MAINQVQYTDKVRPRVDGASRSFDGPDRSKGIGLDLAQPSRPLAVQEGRVR
jgi:hypothetical protein